MQEESVERHPEIQLDESLDSVVSLAVKVQAEGEHADSRQKGLGSGSDLSGDGANRCSAVPPQKTTFNEKNLSCCFVVCTLLTLAGYAKLIICVRVNSLYSSL